MKKFSFLFLTIAALTLVCCKKASEEPVDPVVSDNPGIASAEDFMAFAAAVNAGESTERWQNEEGWVNLLDDIDFNGLGRILCHWSLRAENDLGSIGRFASKIAIKI